MSGLSINGVNTRGQVFELKEGKGIKEALKAGQKDGMDQVYFEAGGKNYVAQGDGLSLKGISRGGLPKAQLEINGQTIEATIKDVDNEQNTKEEGIFHPVALAGGGAIIMAAVPSLFEKGLAIATTFAGPSHISGPSTFSKVVGAVGIAAIVGAEAYTLLKGEDHTKLAPFLGKEVSNTPISLWNKLK